MEQRISIVTLGVASLERSREFYERLGWQQSKASTDGIVFFQAAGHGLGVVIRVRGLLGTQIFLSSARALPASQSPTTPAAVIESMPFLPRRKTLAQCS